jgi:acyl carrier protein
MNTGPMSSLTALQDLIQTKYGLAADVLDPDKPMLELGLDSLAVAEFLFEVEDHFAIRLTDDDPSIDTLRKLSVLVDRSIAAKEASTT